MTDIKLHGRVFIQAKIKTMTGLHIGGSGTGLEIGGVDNEIIRNPLTQEPYIPGSSLRGKMRSQTEKVLGLRQNNPIGKNVRIHVCKQAANYSANGGCPVCHVFGLPGEYEHAEPTRLLVRDVSLDPESIGQNAKTDTPFAELKTEVAIDRVTSAATPRTLERVPAGAEFGPAEFVFGVYDQADFDRLRYVLEALQLVEDDYLGGSGSRGSGKVEFTEIEVYARASKNYGQKHAFELNGVQAFPNVQTLLDGLDDLKNWAQDQIPLE